MNQPLMVTAAALIVFAPLVALACGGDDSREFCGAGDDVQESFDALLDINVIEEGTNAVEEAFATFEEDLSALADAAEDEFSDEIQAVNAAADGVSSAISDTEGEPLPDRADAIGEALSALSDATVALLSSVDSACE